MPGSLLDGIPIGIIMFVGTAGAFLWRKLRRKRATEDLPELARELNLVFDASRYAKGQGRLKGTYQGYEVRIDPEEARGIVVRSKQAVQIDLRTYEQSQRAPFGWVTIFSQDRSFDRFFKTRFASEELAATLADSPEPSRYLEAFTGAYARQIESLILTGEGLKCKLNFGNPPFIPAEAVRTLLPACVALVSFVESCIHAEPQSRAVEAAAHVQAQRPPESD
jgi:hypothetical protein